MKQTQKEGAAEIHYHARAVPTRKMPVFYNPVMKHQRDIAISLIQNYFTGPIRVALPFAGTGVRGIRILKECTDAEVHFNDISEDAIQLIEKNLTYNAVTGACTQLDANVFLRTHGQFDYIDIDPYGSSIYFIESAVFALKKGGILAVTNTDTAPLCGSYPKVCRRRYGATPIESAMKHEFGTRILIKAIQEIGLRHDIALVPVLAYAKDHYIRAYFKKSNSKELCDTILAQHTYMNQETDMTLKKAKSGYGPIWIGSLFDPKLVLPEDSFSQTVREENAIAVPFSYDLHELSKAYKKDIPSFKTLIPEIQKQGYVCSRTIFSKTAIKTTMPKKKLLELAHR